MGKVIFHIDLNAFFANAEILLDPTLKGKPIAVAGSTRRGVVSTASYEARAFGVHSAMPTSEAMRLCPNLIVVPGHYEYYEDLSNKFMKTIRKYSPLVEQASIDECYADMSETILKYKKPLDLAWQIQKELLSDYGLKCSIGVAPNLFLAKMASDMKKPMGITVLRISEVPTKLWPLDISEMRGIGKKTVPYMRNIDINTIGDLANYTDLPRLRNVLGKNSEDMIKLANGYGSNEVISEYDIKSISQSTTLLEDVLDYTEIKGVFNSLSRSLQRRLFNEDKMGYLISITIKYYDFNTIVRSKRLDQPIYRADDLFENALALFDANWNDEPIRLIGIGVADLTSIHEYRTQMNLFDEGTLENDTTEVVDELNHQLTLGGKLLLASSLKNKKVTS